MNRSQLLSLGCSIALGGAVFIAGCHSASTPPESPAPMTSTPATPPAAAPPKEPAAEGKPPTPPVAAKPSEASMTHVLTKDVPDYDSMPDASTKPIGNLKSGSKVLLMVPGVDYSEVLDEDGATVYVPTYGLEPIPAKK